MRRGVGTAIHQIPFSPRLRGRDVFTGGTVHKRRKRRQAFIGDGDHAGLGSGEAALGERRIEGGDDVDAAFARHLDQLIE